MSNPLKRFFCRSREYYLLFSNFFRYCSVVKSLSIFCKTVECNNVMFWYQARVVWLTSKRSLNLDSKKMYLINPKQLILERVWPSRWRICRLCVYFLWIFAVREDKYPKKPRWSLPQGPKSTGSRICAKVESGWFDVRSFE